MIKISYLPDTEIIDLVVAQPWFSLMANGIKAEEFRQDCDHWRKRLMMESGLETSKTRTVFRVNTRGIQWKVWTFKKD